MQEKFLKYADLLLIPQFTKPIFPGGERGIGVELVVDFNVLVDQHRHLVQKRVVYLCDERGVGVPIAKDAESSFMGRGIFMT